jgi:ribose-phosphate pyrophosphokinase
MKRQSANPVPIDPSHAGARSPPQLFALQATAELGKAIADALGQPLALHEEREFEDGEHKARPLDTVMGRDVYVVQSLHSGPAMSTNDKLCRLLFFIGALKDAGAARVTAVVPYLCYARKDRRTKPNDPVTTRYVAGLFESVGIDAIVTLEVHNPVAFENAFRRRTVTLTATPLFVDFARKLADQDLCVVSPDTGGAKRAELLRETLEAACGRPVGKAFADKHRSAGVVSGDLFVGDVAGRTALIIDDLISTGGTLLRAARAARKAGARRVMALVTHGLFMPGAAEVLGDPAIESSSPTAYRHFGWDPRQRGTRSRFSPRHRCSPRRSGVFTTAAPSRTLPCSKHDLEACGVAGGDGEIGAGQTRPLFGRARLGLGEMRDGEARPQGGAIGPVEVMEGEGQILAQPTLEARPDVATRPRGAEPLALQIEVGDLVKGVDGAQARIELQAVDDPHLVIEPDMLRPQVAVSIDDAAAAYPRSQHGAAFGEEAALQAIDASDQGGRKS